MKDEALVGIIRKLNILAGAVVTVGTTQEDLLDQIADIQAYIIELDKSK